MRKSSIRAFGMAIFLIGALIAIADRFDINIGLPTVASTTDQDMANLQKKLEVANKEIASLKAAAKQNATNSNSNDKNNNASVTSKEDDTNEAEKADKIEPSKDNAVATMQLNIYRGISTYDIAKMLEDEKIISNHIEMDLLLANPKYSRNLQIGTYEVNSTMSLEEIAKAITRQQ